LKLPDISTKIKRLASLDMPVEALKVLLSDLAAELDRVEARLSKDRRRKPVEIPRNAVEIPAKTPENPCLAPVLDNITTTSKEDLESPPSPLTSKPLDPPGFQEFWDAYPKRAGNADRKPAVKAFRAALKRTDLKTLLWAAGRYAADCRAKGKIGTEFVKQARTWLNADGWTEYGQSVSEPVTTITPQVVVAVGTAQWEAWKRYRGKSIPEQDIQVNGRYVRGWWFPSEFPPVQNEQAA
jgi:hypothetical protein